jgi:hypothetical protein
VRQKEAADQGAPDGMCAMDASIVKSVELTDARIVVLDWSHSNKHHYENLLCYRPDGSMKWKAELPPNSGVDCFVGIALDGSELRANTFSGLALWLDFETGRTIRTSFTK